MGPSVCAAMVVFCTAFSVGEIVVIALSAWIVLWSPKVFFIATQRNIMHTFGGEKNTLWHTMENKAHFSPVNL